MARRRIWPWLPLLALAAVAVVLAVFHFMGRATTPDAPPAPHARGDVAAWMRPAFLELQLRDRGLNVTAVSCKDRPDATYLFVGQPDPALVDGLPAEADYADCWRGVLLFDPHGGGSRVDDPYEFRDSTYRVFGDPALIAAFRDPDSGVAKSHDVPKPRASAVSE